MTLPLQLFMVQGSYLNYTPTSVSNPNPSNNGDAGLSVVLNFSQVLNTPLNNVDWSQISVSWAGLTQSPTSGSFIGAPNGSGSSSQLQLNFANPFPVASYLDASLPPGNNAIIATVNPAALPGDTFPVNGQSQLIPITTTSAPYSPAAVPTYIGFTVSQDLRNYLDAIGSINGSSVTSNSQVVYVSYPTGGPTWGAGTTTGVPGQASSTNFPEAQYTPNGSMSVSYNYALSDLNQTIPSGGSFTQGGNTYYYGLYNSSGPQGPVTIPNIPVNYVQGGHFYISMATPSLPQGGQLAYTSDDLGTAPTAVGDPNGNANLIWAIGLEPYVATQPGWNVGMTDANADLTYIDLYQFPVNLQVYGPDGNPQSGTAASGPKSINGGAGTAASSGMGDIIFATLTNQSLYGQLTNQIQGYGRVVGPTLAVDATDQLPNAYHSWDAYFDHLVTSNSTAIILSGGTQNSPAENAGSDLFNYVATFVKTLNGNQYVLLTSYVTNPTADSTYTVIYVPYSSSSIMPGTDTLTTYMNQGGGIYGGNAGYVIISNVTSAQLTTLQNVTQSADFNGMTTAVQPALGGDASTAFAVGDMLSGFNFGVLGSQVLYTSPDTTTITNQMIGGLPSYLWWDAQGPVANNVWGPWAQPDNAGLTNTQTTNSFWNTYQFALNGNIAYNPVFYQKSSNVNNTAFARRALTPDVYGYAFSDRLSNSKPISVEYNSVGEAPPYTGPSPQPPTPMPWGIGGSMQSSYLQVTVGAPTIFDPLFPAVVQGHLNNSQWDTQVFWSGSSNSYQMMYTSSSGAFQSFSDQITLEDHSYGYTGAGKLIGSSSQDQPIWENNDGIMYGQSTDNGQSFTLSSIAKPTGDAWQYWTNANTIGDGPNDPNELLWVYQKQFIGVTLLDGQGNKISDNWYSGLAGAWTPESTADFNNDGRSDILWRDTSTQSASYGAVAATITATDGTSFSTSVWMSMPGQNWQYFGTGDFNGDHITDTVWTTPIISQNGSTLQAMAIMISNPEMTTGPATLGSYWFSTPGEGWYLKGIGNFNNDTYADTYWWNDNLAGGATFLTNDPSTWSSSGAPNAQAVWWGSPGEGWQYSSLSKVNDDAYSDVTFVYSSPDQQLSSLNGNLAVQISSSAGSVQSSQLLGANDPNWTTVPTQPLWG